MGNNTLNPVFVPGGNIYVAAVRGVKIVGSLPSSNVENLLIIKTNRKREEFYKKDKIRSHSETEEQQKTKATTEPETRRRGGKDFRSLLNSQLGINRTGILLNNHLFGRYDLLLWCGRLKLGLSRGENCFTIKLDEMRISINLKRTNKFILIKDTRRFCSISLTSGRPARASWGDNFNLLSKLLLIFGLFLNTESSLKMHLMQVGEIFLKKIRRAETRFQEPGREKMSQRQITHILISLIPPLVIKL